jgi:hypothetical protein
MRTPTKTMLAVGAISLAMLAAVACGKPSNEPTAQTTTLAANVGGKASCDTRSALRTCNEFPDRKSFDMEKALCEAERGKFALAPCPSADQVGTCSLSDGETKRYYGSRDQAKADCEAVGGLFR